ncbi:unnamed protein product [Symbiodinium necroappetens]|uniref:Uncharacterized protein n=1 Tax=Symbiodinium necroappetens TaxID=1628268 RepID=A0A812ST17_9DINO|nr:unnamed protein product [Symbiodinium necroappetens]
MKTNQYEFTLSKYSVIQNEVSAILGEPRNTLRERDQQAPVGRDPASYISDAAWSAMASGGAFATSAPETAAPASSPRHDTESIASGSTTVPNLNRPAGAWDEPQRGVCPSDEVDFFEQLQTAGLLYQNFRLGYDAAGNLIDPTLARRADWNKADAYQWAPFAATTEAYVHAEHVINTIPSHQNLHGFTSFDTSHVQWYLAGWNHEIYNHRKGRRERRY